MKDKKEIRSRALFEIGHAHIRNESTGGVYYLWYVETDRGRIGGLMSAQENPSNEGHQWCPVTGERIPMDKTPEEYAKEIDPFLMRLPILEVDEVDEVNLDCPLLQHAENGIIAGKLDPDILPENVRALLPDGMDVLAEDVRGDK